MNIIKNTLREDERFGLSSVVWSKKSGAGGSGLEHCWQTREEQSLIQTSWKSKRRRQTLLLVAQYYSKDVRGICDDSTLIVNVYCAPMEQVLPHRCLEGHQKNTDVAGPYY